MGKMEQSVPGAAWTTWQMSLHRRQDKRQVDAGKPGQGPKVQEDTATLSPESAGADPVSRAFSLLAETRNSVELSPPPKLSVDSNQVA